LRLALLFLVLFAAGLLFALMTFFLKNAEFGGGFIGAAREARFLRLETSDLLFVGEEGVNVDERQAQFGVVFGELLRGCLRSIMWTRGDSA
jgi:hypothetical protein